MTQQNQPSDSLLFPVSPLQKAIADIIPTIRGGSKWSAFSAIRYLNRATKLSGSDKEMAIFCAITAEEESASAVFRGLKLRRYTNADKLQVRDHLHKSTLYRMIRQCYDKIVTMGFGIDHLSFFIDAENRLAMEIHTDPTIISDRLFPKVVIPIPPLKLQLRETFGNSAPQKPDFKSYFENRVNAENLTLKKHLEDGRNLRNQILYASENGYPQVSEPFQRVFEEYKNRTFVNLGAYLLIVQYHEKQEFVQDVLDALLEVVSVVKPVMI